MSLSMMRERANRSKSAPRLRGTNPATFCAWTFGGSQIQEHNECVAQIWLDMLRHILNIDMSFFIFLYIFGHFQIWPDMDISTMCRTYLDMSGHDWMLFFQTYPGHWSWAWLPSHFLLENPEDCTVSLVSSKLLVYLYVAPLVGSHRQ